MVQFVHGLVLVSCAYDVLFKRLEVFLSLLDLKAEKLVLVHLLLLLSLIKMLRTTATETAQRLMLHVIRLTSNVASGVLPTKSDRNST